MKEGRLLFLDGPLKGGKAQLQPGVHLGSAWRDLDQEKLKESWWEQEEPQSQLRLDSNEVKAAQTTFLLHPEPTFPARELPCHWLCIS